MWAMPEEAVSSDLLLRAATLLEQWRSQTWHVGSQRCHFGKCPDLATRVSRGGTNLGCDAHSVVGKWKDLPQAELVRGTAAVIKEARGA